MPAVRARWRSVIRRIEALWRRRLNIEGEVELEIVVRSNGTVGEVKVLRGLRGGLNEQAIAAVKQWRFAPARMKGTPVDVVVEVGVEFKLR